MIQFFIYFIFLSILLLLYQEYKSLLKFIDELLEKKIQAHQNLNHIELENERLKFLNQSLLQRNKALRELNSKSFNDDNTPFIKTAQGNDFDMLAREITDIKNMLSRKLQ